MPRPRKEKAAPKKKPGRPPNYKPGPGQDVIKSAAALKVERINYLIGRMREGKSLSKGELDLISDHIDDLEAEGGNPVKERFRNAQAVANHYGVTPGTVSEHVRRGNISPNADGSFDKAVTDAYWCSKRGRQVVPLRGKAGSKGNGNGNGKAATATPEHSLQSKIDAVRLRKTKAEAETKELIAAQLKGSLISKDDMLRVWCSRVEMFRDALMHLAVRLPPVLVNLSQTEIEGVLRTEAESIIKAFAKHGKYTPRSPKPK